MESKKSNCDQKVYKNRKQNNSTYILGNENKNPFYKKMKTIYIQLNLIN